MLEYLKYLRIDVLALVVAVATFIVTCLAYRYSRRSEKRRIKSEIARKEAMLKAVEFSSRHKEYTVVQHCMVKKAELEAELEELKRQL